jgi:hypothetical protein
LGEVKVRIYRICYSFSPAKLKRKPKEEVLIPFAATEAALDERLVF